MIDPRKLPTWQVSLKQRSRARSLRRDTTDSERIIWNAVRAHRMHGASFRRQTPIGPYIVDFVCHEANLVIEIDGGQHFEPEHIKRDARRDAFLSSKGYRVLRFNNHDVMSNRQGVLETIAAAVTLAPSPPLPRTRGRERTESAALHEQQSPRRVR
jgi:very-short-patch-repair endonuclease